MKCARCNKEINTWTMSWFNTDHICIECKDDEKNHPDYQKAKEKVYEEEAKGNNDYEGIGWTEYKK